MCSGRRILRILLLLPGSHVLLLLPPLSFVVRQEVSLHFWLLLSEFQGSFPQLFVEESVKGPTILGGMLDIIMDSAK